jgi:hypothetical protein
MLDKFNFFVNKLLQFANQGDPFILDNEFDLVSERGEDEVILFRTINAAFLVAICGKNHPNSSRAGEFLERMAKSPGWEEIGNLYLTGMQAIERELNLVSQHEPEVEQRMESVFQRINNLKSQAPDSQMVEVFWAFTHPEATGIWSHESQRIAELRKKRKVSISHLNTDPIHNPARQVLFTANALLTLPAGSNSLDELNLSEDLRGKLSAVVDESQIYWYDHPVQIGVEAGKNEILYGLKGLQCALEFERAHGNAKDSDQLTFVLSVSVTHNGLHDIARQYISEELQRDQSLPGLNVFVFTETDTQQLVEHILAPAAKHYLGEEAIEKFRIFGVDGEYGRHYTFLKAITAFWQVLIDPQISATFKIDLDQVFPQEELLRATGKSAFEHLKTPLWGASGLDADKQSVELGLIAGALVNESDINRDLFTADVPLPASVRDFPLDELGSDSASSESTLPGARMVFWWTACAATGLSRPLSSVGLKTRRSSSQLSPKMKCGLLTCTRQV